jgi:hypothetical protein
MARRLAGLVAACLAGAWIGFTVEWATESGGWHGTQEMHLAAAAGRGALWVAVAFGLVEAFLWRRPDRWLLRLVATSLLGAVTFVGVVFVPGHVSYIAAFPDQGSLASVAGEEAGRVVFFAAQLLPIMGIVVFVSSQMRRLATYRS